MKSNEDMQLFNVYPIKMGWILIQCNLLSWLNISALTTEDFNDTFNVSREQKIDLRKLHTDYECTESQGKKG